MRGQLSRRTTYSWQKVPCPTTKHVAKDHLPWETIFCSPMGWSFKARSAVQGKLTKHTGIERLQKSSQKRIKETFQEKHICVTVDDIKPFRLMEIFLVYVRLPVMNKSEKHKKCVHVVTVVIKQYRPYFTT